MSESLFCVKVRVTSSSLVSRTCGFLRASGFIRRFMGKILNGCLQSDKWLTMLYLGHLHSNQLSVCVFVREYPAKWNHQRQLDTTCFRSPWTSISKHLIIVPAACNIESMIRCYFRLNLNITSEFSSLIGGNNAITEMCLLDFFYISQNPKNSLNYNQPYWILYHLLSWQLHTLQSWKTPSAVFDTCNGCVCNWKAGQA